jgi:hypothetical protein
VFPRTLCIYGHACQSVYWRTLTPATLLVEHGYSVGWAQDIHDIQHDAYDQVIFSYTPWIARERLEEQVHVARRKGKVVLIDHLVAAPPIEEAHGGFVMHKSYDVLGYQLLESYIDPHSWPATPRWTPALTIGLASDTPVAPETWKVLFPALARIREDYPETHLIAHPFMKEAEGITTDFWNASPHAYDHCVLKNGIDIALCAAVPVQPLDAYTAALAGSVIVADQSYRSIVNPTTAFMVQNDWYTAIQAAITQPARRRETAMRFKAYVEERRAYTRGLAKIAHAWEVAYLRATTFTSKMPIAA